MHGPDGLVAVGNALAQVANELAIELGNRVAHGVGHVDGGCTLLDDGLDHARQKIGFAAIAVLRAEFDVFDEIAPEAHRLLGLLQHLLGCHAQLFLHVQRTGGDESVNASAVGPLQGLGRTRDVAVVGA